MSLRVADNDSAHKHKKAKIDPGNKYKQCSVVALYQLGHMKLYIRDDRIVVFTIRSYFVFEK